MEHIRVEELEDDDAHLLEAATTEVGHHAQPVVILQFLFRHSLERLQHSLGDETLELAEGLLVEDRADVCQPIRMAFT